MQTTRLLLGISLLATALLATTPALAKPIGASEAERAARRALGAEIPRARLLWVNDHRIMHARIGHFLPRAITPAGHREYRPRWSPDGHHVAFQRGADEIWLMDASFERRQKILDAANTHDWTFDGGGVTAISADGHRVLHYRLRDGKTTVLFDSRRAPFNGASLSQSAVLHPGGRYLLTFRLEPEHTSEIIDLVEQRYISNARMRRGDCNPMWSPDGRRVLTTARTASRPILSAPFDSASGRLGQSELLIELGTPAPYYMHDATISNDHRFAVFGGKVLRGPGRRGDREIYAWRVGSPSDAVIRLTFDSANDFNPHLHVPARRSD